MGYNRCMRISPKGFTLIELMVVLAIVVLVSLVLLVSNQRFNSSILLRSLAYQVGLSVREAQLYGVAVRGAGRDIGGNLILAQCSTGDSSQFCSSFGVHFDKAQTTQYVLFPDISNNGVYDDGGLVSKTYRTQYGFTISNFCAVGTTVRCSKVCPIQYPDCTKNISTLDIVFRRPSPNAIIRAKTNADSLVGPFASAYIEVSAPGGSTRSVSVSLTGQIVITGGGN